MNMDDLADCMATADETRVELQVLERELAIRYQVPGDPHVGLCHLELMNELDENDPRIREWQALDARSQWFIDEPETPHPLSEFGEVVTFDKARLRLYDIERRLRERHGVRDRITLMAQLRDAVIVEDELVADWHDAHASYLEFVRDSLNR